MPFPRIFYYSRCSPLKSFISTVHPPIPLYKVRFFISFRSIEVRCLLRLADFYKAVFKPWIFTGSLVIACELCDVVIAKWKVPVLCTIRAITPS
ncbi:hypothetical protein CMV_015255 [Castanea mollissima]|uniref:Uncharacterized protein n=1 Tax=Castanea mollissima TaxID=60419 RepID=A0A8J4R9F1_9ROSI|nr:hypothetical protein CMV_015255 [Castanea mollissima]